MIKWFVIITLGLPVIIYSEIVLLIMNSNKEKYSLQQRYNVVRNTVKWINTLTRRRYRFINEDIIKTPRSYGRVYISNHLHLFDIMTVIENSPKPIICISKKENSKVPFLTTFMKALDTLCIDRESARQSLKICKEAGELVQQGTDIIIYAEGTRSKDGNVAEFKAATSAIVQYAKSEIVLITTHNTKKPLSFRWFTYPKEYVNIKYFEPLPYEFFLQHRKDFAVVTRQMISDQLDEFKKEYDN